MAVRFVHHIRFDKTHFFIYMFRMIVAVDVCGCDLFGVMAGFHIIDKRYQRLGASVLILEADIDASVDAERIEALGARSIQAHTDGMCHMDAGMTRTGLEAMGLEEIDLAFLENIGNLICPAEYDTGAGRNVMILSVPEGDDKPLKYPLMFQESDALVITKTDTLGYFDFDMDACRRRALHLNPEIKIFTVSAKTGEGMEDWENWLKEETSAWKHN